MKYYFKYLKRFIIQLSTCSVMTLWISPLNAQSLNLFVEALRDGHAETSLPANPINDRVIASLQKASNNNSPIIQEAQLLYRFEEQPSCGRIAFALTQPSTRTIWRETGGELNICENGKPPMQHCKQGGLVPYGQKCSDGSKAVDTLEIQNAIKKSLASGSLSEAQILQKIKNTTIGPK